MRVLLCSAALVSAWRVIANKERGLVYTSSSSLIRPPPEEGGRLGMFQKHTDWTRWLFLHPLTRDMDESVLSCTVRGLGQCQGPSTARSLRSPSGPRRETWSSSDPSLSVNAHAPVLHPPPMFSSAATCRFACTAQFRAISCPQCAWISVTCPSVVCTFRN